MKTLNLCELCETLSVHCINEKLKRKGRKVSDTKDAKVATVLKIM